MGHRAVNLHDLLIASVVLSLAGCGSGPLSEEQVQKVFSSSTVFDIVQNSSQVEAYRIDPDGVDRGTATVADYPVLSGPIVIEGATREELRTVLNDADTYDWSGLARGCGFQPGVRLSFEGLNSQVDVLFCFECDILAVFENGKKTSGKAFDPGRPALVSLMKQIFPDDAVVQGLSEQR